MHRNVLIFLLISLVGYLSINNTHYLFTNTFLSSNLADRILNKMGEGWYFIAFTRV